MANEFYALLGRMRYITRWGLMRNSFSENIQEHSHQVAVLAHALALIRREILGLEGPEPDMIRKALEDLGADGCVYVGDTQIDVQTARNVNAPCLCVLWGFRDRDQLEAVGAEHFCETAADLPAAVEKLMKG